MDFFQQRALVIELIDIIDLFHHEFLDESAHFELLGESEEDEA